MMGGPPAAYSGKQQQPPSKNDDEDSKKDSEEESDDDDCNRLGYTWNIKIERNAEGEKVMVDDKVNLVFKQTLGRGSYCKVVRAVGYYDDGEVIPYAIKVYKKAELRKQVNQVVNVAKDKMGGLGMRKLYDQIQEEVQTWGTLLHDNIVKAFIWYEDDKHSKMYLMI